MANHRLVVAGFVLENERVKLVLGRGSVLGDAVGQIKFQRDCHRHVLWLRVNYYEIFGGKDYRSVFNSVLRRILLPLAAGYSATHLLVKLKRKIPLNGNSQIRTVQFKAAHELKRLNYMVVFAVLAGSDHVLELLSVVPMADAGHILLFQEVVGLDAGPFGRREWLLGGD